MRRVASLDFGQKRIGIAMSDMQRKMALPLTTVEGGKHAITNIKKALPMHEVDLIVIGLPLELSGKKGEMALLVEKFAKEVETGLNVKVFLLDERLSSKGADVRLKEISLNRKERSEKIDMVAATLLLQTYLDAHGQSPS